MSSRTVIVLMVCGLAGGAGGDIIEFTFEGFIDSVGGPIPAEVDVGDSFEFVYRFDSNAADSDGAPNFGLYAGAAEQPNLVVDDWTAPGLGDGDISVLDNGFAGDSYSGYVQTPLIWVSVGLTDFDGSAFDGDSLPLDLNLADWEIRNFSVEVQVGPSFWNASGTIFHFSSRIVPGPGVVAVGLLGSLAGFKRRRR